MKIGVALSGCDIGGVSAFHILKWLEDKGFGIEMVSASGIPSVMALSYACGHSRERADKIAAEFLKDARELDLDSAVGNAAGQLNPERLREELPVAVNAADVETGGIATFTNAYSLQSGKLATYPLTDSYDALSSTISYLDGLSSFRYGRRCLCDFSAWHGCPLYPLKLRGIVRVVSISFLPGAPRIPYEALVRRMTASTASGADLHIPVEFPAPLPTHGDYAEFAIRRLESCIDCLV